MDQVAQIREKIDLVALISESLPLKRAGRNFTTICPFHNEKSPSFVVSPERQIWHCFGCQKGGDAFTFLMEYEHLEFPESLRILAQRTGITLETKKFVDSGLASKKELLYGINRLAAEFYHYILFTHPAGKKALSYVQKTRGIKEAVIKTFMVGFAPQIGSTLTSYLIRKKGYKPQDIIDAGLASQRSGRMFDFFAKRIMFALFDHRGNVVGFSGRIFEENERLNAKYVNTRETLVYHKGSTFFGLNVTKHEIKKENRAIIMEGEFDVMSSFQEGIGNVVAVKGTALTEEQASLIARFAPEVSLCFDTDSAGYEALKRSVVLLEKKGITPTVVATQNGKDPDEALRTDPILFKKAAKHPVSAYDFILEQAIVHHSKQTAEGKKRIADELLPLLSLVQNEIVKEHYLKKLASELDTSYESVEKQVERMQKKETTTTKYAVPQTKRVRKELLEEYLVALILQSENTKDVFAKIWSSLSDVSFSVPAYQKILVYLEVYLKQVLEFTPTVFAHTLPVELLKAFDTSYLLPLHSFSKKEEYLREVEKVAGELQILSLKTKMKLISEKIKVLEKQEEAGDTQKTLDELNNEFSHLASLLQKVSSSP